MKKFSFVIKGNQDDIYGNPIPYHRVVKRALWLPAAKRYNGWKSHVRKTFYAEYPSELKRAGANLLPELQPFTTTAGQRMRMIIVIYPANGAHGDPDNIWKGIADALFKNDKFLDGSFETRYSPTSHGRVEVDITAI